MPKHNNFGEHAAPFMRKAMRTAMAQARKTWKGKKQLTAGQKRSLTSMRKNRELLNARIRKIQGK